MEKNKKAKTLSPAERWKDRISWLFDLTDWKMLLRSIPGVVTMLFVLSVVIMNLMASKVIVLTPYLGITGGLLLSWVPFLTMDIVVKTYGAKAATKLNLLGLGMNLICIGIFQLVTVIEIGSDPGTYDAFNATFSQTWQIFVASSIAYVVSGIVNNVTNVSVGRLFRKDPDGKAAFMARSYISTMIGQLVDNFVFTSLAFLVFFKLSIGSTLGYTFQTVLGTSFLGALLELLMEVIFSPIGYRICRKWREDSVGSDYLAYCGRMEVYEDIGRVNY